MTLLRIHRFVRCLCVAIVVGLLVTAEGRAMTKSEFWDIVERAKGAGGDREHAQRLAGLLKALPATRIAEFAKSYEASLAEADKDDLWAAAMLMNGGQCSDDCFNYFRSWLISRGKDIFQEALRSPDSLARLTLGDGKKKQSVQYESFGAAPARAYREVTGKDLVATETATPIRSAPLDWQQFTNETLQSRFPSLWKKYGKAKLSADKMREELGAVAAQTESVAVPGLGQVRVGTKLRHKEFGIGVVRALIGTRVVNAVIKFDDGERPMLLSPEHFEPVTGT